MTLWHTFLRGIVLAGACFLMGTGIVSANHAVRISDLDAGAFVLRYNDLAAREDAVVRLSPPLLSKDVKLRNYRVYEARLLGSREGGRLFFNVNAAGALSSIVVKSEKEPLAHSLALRRALTLALESLGMTEEERAQFFSSEEKEQGGDGVLRHAWCRAAGRKIVAFYDSAHAPDILVLYAWDE